MDNYTGYAYIIAFNKGMRIGFTTGTIFGIVIALAVISIGSIIFG